MNWPKWIKLAHLVHWGGLVMVVAGFASYWYTDWGQAIGGLLIIASAIAIGLLMMAPYPVMLFFAWARNQDQQNNNKK